MSTAKMYAVFDGLGTIVVASDPLGRHLGVSICRPSDVADEYDPVMGLSMAMLKLAPDQRQIFVNKAGQKKHVLLPSYTFMVELARIRERLAYELSYRKRMLESNRIAKEWLNRANALKLDAVPETTYYTYKHARHLAKLIRQGALKIKPSITPVKREYYSGLALYDAFVFMQNGNENYVAESWESDRLL